MDFSHIINKFAKDKKFRLIPISVNGFTAYRIGKGDILSALQFVKEHEALRFTILTEPELEGTDLAAEDLLINGSSGEGGTKSRSLKTTKSKSASEAAKTLAALSGRFLSRSDSACDCRTILRSC